MPINLLLKVLTGVHSGVEVNLDDGSYTIGGGSEDDIQFRDASLKAGHALLHVENGRVEIRANAGDVLFANGATLAAGEDKVVTLEPLQVIVLGTTRLTFGAPGANWSTVTEDEEFRRTAQPGAAGAPETQMIDEHPLGALWRRFLGNGLTDKIEHFLTGLGSRGTPYWIPIAGFGFIVVVVVYFATSALNFREAPRRNFEADRIKIEDALATLPFSAKVKLQQDVDGQIFVKGIIKDVTERRALINALESTKIPYKSRIAIADTIIMDVNNLVSAERVKVKPALKEDGTLTIAGTILDPERAKKFTDLVKEQVVGPTSIDLTKLKDGNSLIDDIAKAARDNGIGTSVVFTLIQGRYAEATGTLPDGKAKEWIAFLESYSELFADKIPLRSVVQVVPGPDAPEGENFDALPTDALVLGGPGTGTDRVLDLNKLNKSKINLADIFVGKKPEPAKPAGDQQPIAAANTTQDAPKKRTAAAEEQVLPPNGVAPSDPLKLITPPELASILDQQALSGPSDKKGASDGILAPNIKLDDPEKLIDKWAKGTLPTLKDGKDKSLIKALDDLAKITSVDARKSSMLATEVRGYLTIDKTSKNVFANGCRPDMLTDLNGIPRILFWLDLLSQYDGLSIASFDRDTQRALASAMVNPGIIHECLAKASNMSLADYFMNSAFMTEVSINPAFIKFIARDVPPKLFKLAGVNMVNKPYVVAIDGKRYSKGASLDLYSRISEIGELGLVIETSTGVEIVVFDEQILWTVQNQARATLN